MSHPLVWTSAPDAGSSDRVYLDLFGAVSGLRYGHAYPGGCKALSCQLSVPPEFSHRALTPGRDVGVTVGAEDTWLGTLNAPTVSDDGRRQITADGDSAAIARFVALGLGTHNALNPNEVIDAARLSGRHSRFRRVDTFPVPDGQRADDAAFMMDEALTQSANAAGKRWRVDLDRVVRMYPYDGDGQRLLLRARQDIGRTLDGFVTRLDAAFIDAETGLYRVEHADAPASDTGSTFYPAFYTPDGSAYAARGFTLYTDGTTITAYVIGAPVAATVLSLSSPAVDLVRVQTSQFYSQFQAAGSLAVGATGRTATYRAATGSPSLGTGSQEGIAHRGTGSLQATGNIAPREAVVDLTGQGAFTQAQALAQLAEHLSRAKSQPHYDGTWTADQGDLVNMGGVPVDLATVRAGMQLVVVAVDPTRNLSLQADDVLVTIGETEYDADTGTLQLTPDASPDLPEKTPTVDFATGLAR